MNILDAYELTLEKALETGVDVEIVKHKPHPDNIKKFAGKGLPVEKWRRVQFKVDNEIDILKISEAANYLGQAGITFDSGGTQCIRDWEIDWSFDVSDEPDEEWRERREEVESTLKNNFN